MLRRGREGVRLGGPAARAAADARRGRHAGRLGHGHRALPLPDVRGGGAGDAAPDGTGLVETSAIDMGQGAWTALAQIAADSLGLDIDQIEFRAGPPTCPTAASPAAPAIRRRPAPRSTRPAATSSRRLAEPATADPGSPLYGAGNAGVVARGGRLHVKDDETRSESYADILARAGLAEVEGSGKGARDPAAAQDMRCRRTVPSSPRSRSIPISARFASRAWSAPSRRAGSSTRGWRRASSWAA